MEIVKKYDDLDVYEKTIEEATIERRLEIYAKEIEQMVMTLGMSIHLDTTFIDRDDGTRKAFAYVYFLPRGGNSIRRQHEGEGSFFGIVKEAMNQTAD